jgi:hypothetical protein
LENRDCVRHPEKVLVIGCPIKDRAWVLPEWFAALEAQDVEHKIIVLYTPSDDDTIQILNDHGAITFPDTIAFDGYTPPGRPVHEIDGHVWGNLERYTYMATLRNELMALAYSMEADYFFSLDSDIILPPDGLQRLLSFAQTHPGVIAPAVNMVPKGTVWNTMSWDATLRGSAMRYAEDFGSGKAGRRDVVMAAMLLDRGAMEACAWAAHPQGEDVGFSLNAFNSQVPLWWVPEVRCRHRMKRFG